ncbi:acyl-CoA dehydrogenase family protein [Qipengyuania sp. DY56-A-20]|jgi:alkylation response protein AidB-like acyl-CoA dehydrogenase|uniref:Acyl-CoA dehydrogenase family protein n=1 Tax=Qipengyuania benthica TaxID=3067651 RepID=A0ABT9H9X9_9SPHN|nr:acyl-CoA dehydrogenase family protein [Qipengyuania sp. DY56-A-20]MDP4540127.1 acyl-CoA dehydrogenase family protein [Qipengyuania sp. DY56-A-20]
MAVLNEEQEMLRDMAREWTSNESPVTEFRKVRAGGSDEAFDRKAYATMAEMGWVGVIIPEAQGGSDFGWLSAGLVVEELGKTLTASPLVASTVAAAAILLGGSQEQQAKWLPGLASGEIIGTLAVDEGPRHDPAKLETTVSGGKLSGTKAFVPEAHGADLFVVAAKDGLYLVEKGEGVALSTRKLTDQRSHAEVRFDGAAADRLAGGGDSLLDDVLDRARILTACEMLGMAQAVFDTTLDYLKQRVQFNQVLATFQALQHRMADLFGDLAMMRSAVEGGLQALDSGFGVARAATIAKAEANRVLHTVTREGVQLHGGMGMTDEYDVGFYLKRARVLEASFGSTSFLKNRFATIAGY